MELLKKIGLNDIVSYVQHGDLTATNVLLKNGGYSLIDFDTIGIRPALYDFFRLLLDTKKGFIYYINGYFDEEIKSVLSVSEDNKTNIESIKDKYLACFYVFSGWDKSKISRIVPSNYFYTNKIITMLNNK